MVIYITRRARVQILGSRGAVDQVEGVSIYIIPRVKGYTSIYIFEDNYHFVFLFISNDLNRRPSWQGGYAYYTHIYNIKCSNFYAIILYVNIVRVQYSRREFLSKRNKP